jgi:serine/threonine protein kinase
MLHFGNYDLVRRIDVGGMGEVYLARQRTAFNREVAVKIIRSDLVHDMVARKRFLREAEVSAHLKHDHILPLVEFGEEQGRLFLVTPYIEGGTLARRLHRGPLSLAEVHQLFSALVRAIAYIHRRGVIHRDLKPSNILLDQESGTGEVYVRLIDFGIATISGMAASAPLTTAGHEMGTIAYMAPERLEGVAAPSNDIYSLGVILYQMLTGHLPTAEKAVVLPAPLEDVVRRCMAQDPHDRYASADEVLKAFDFACRSLTASLASQPPSEAAADSPTELDDSSPTPKRLTTTRPISAVAPESTKGKRIAAPPDSHFEHDDYNAPTAFLAPNPSEQQGQQLADVGIVVATPPRQQRGRRSLLAFMVLSVVLVFLTIAGIVFFSFGMAISASVTVTPQVHPISAVFTVTAKPGLQSSDVGTASIPTRVFSSTQTSSQQGPTTGQANCVFGIFDCQQAVDSADVQRLAAQLEPAVQAQIAQDLQRQAQAAGVTTVGTVHYDNPTGSANPPIGTVSKTVTVTVTEQGSIEGFKASDVQSMARLLLRQRMQQQYGPNYVLRDALTQVGQPVIEGVDANSAVTLQIAAGSVAQYQFPANELQDMQNHIKGMKLKAALAFLQKQPGVDPNSIIARVSYGDTLPTNVEQIKITHSDPVNLPPVQLPTVQPTATQTPTT